MAMTHPIVAGVRFKDVPGFPGYCVGDDGSIWSCRKVRGLGHGKGTASFLCETWTRKATCLTQDGYWQVSLYRSGAEISARRGSYATMRVHRIVLEAFVGSCPDGMEGCHNNGDRLDNRLSNLRWDTQGSNFQDRDIHGTTAKGERHGQAKVDSATIAIMRTERESGKSYGRIAKSTGISKRQVMRILKGESWQHLLL